MIVGSLEIQLRADLARLSRDMSGARQIVSDTSASMARAANAAKAALAGMAAGFGGRELIEMTDQYTKFTAQLKLATSSQQEYAQAYADVKRISTTAQAELGATGVLYARIANGTKELGIAQSQVVKITEAVNLALTVSGATSSESASAMMQLSQAFASGTLRGEEFNAVNEAAPRLMKALADGIGVPVGALKKMAEEGKISSGVMAKVLGDDKLISDLREGAKQIQTISGALTVLKNNVMEVVGTQAKASGFVDVTTKGILALSKSIDALASGLATGAKVGAAYVAAMVIAPAVFQATATAVGNLRLQLALARLEMASGASAASLLSAGVGGVAVSAQWASGSLGKLTIATNVLFAAFTGWQIGTYLNDQFVEAQIAGELMADGLLTAWERIKFGAKVAFDAIFLVARNTITTIMNLFAGIWEAGAKGLRMIGKDGAADEVDALAGRFRKAADAQGTFAGRTAEARAEMEKNLKVIDQDTQRRITAALAADKLSEATNNGTTAAATAAAKKKELTEAEKKAIEAATKQASDFIARLKEEQQALGLNESQLRMLAAAKVAALAPTEKLRMAVMVQAVAHDRATVAAQASAESIKALDKMNEDYAKSLGMTASLLADQVDAARQEAEQQEATAATYGMTALQIRAAEVARLEEQFAQRNSLGLTLDEIETLEKLIAAKKRSATSMREVEGLEEQKRMWGDIERTAHDTFISIFDSGKSAFDRLKDTLKNGLLDLLYQMTVRKWIVNISGQVSGQGGLTQAAGLFGGSGSDGSSLGNAMSLVSMGKSIYSGFTGGLATTLSGWASSAGSVFGSSAMSSFGAGMSAAGGNTGMAAMYASAQTSGNLAARASAGASAGTYAIPIAGWIAAGMALSNSLYKQGWNAENGSLTDSLGGKAIMPFNAPMLHLNQGLQKLGLSNSMANMLSGASTVSALFGRKDPKVETQGLRGTISASGFDGDTYANIVEKGGLFRSTKRYTTGAALSGEQDAGLDSTVQAMIEAVKGFGSAMGLETSVITGYTKAIKLELGADEAKNQEAIAKMFGEIGDELSLRLVPSIASLGKTGETASATLQRVATDYAAVDNSLSSIGKQFGQVGIQSLIARERLVGLFGGADAFMQSTAAYAQNFLTEAERMKPVADALAVEMSQLGLVSVTTRAQFKQVIDGLNVSTDAGAAQYAALMKLAEAFAAVHPATEVATADLSTYRTALTDAYNAESEALKATIDRMGSFASSLRSVRDSALLGNLSPLSPQQKYAEAKSQYEAVLSAARGGDAGAQSNYQSAFTSFLEASRTVFASSSQYQADFAYAQAATEEAARWAELEADVGRAQLDVLKSQVSGIIEVNKSVLSVRDALLQYQAALGGNTMPLTAVAPPVNTPIPYSSYGTSNTEALVAEVKALNARIDAQTKVIEAQTGKLTVAAYDSADDSADRITRSLKAASYSDNRVAPE